MLESIENTFQIVPGKLFLGERKETPGRTITVTRGKPLSAVSSLAWWALHATEVNNRAINGETGLLVRAAAPPPQPLWPRKQTFHFRVFGDLNA